MPLWNAINIYNLNSLMYIEVAYLNTTKGFFVNYKS